MLKRKPKNYWKDIDNIIFELKPLIEQHGRFPTNTEMTKAGLTSLARFIAKYHGGTISLAKKLGVKTYDQMIGRKHQNTWTEEIVCKEYIEYIKWKNINYYPSRYELASNGCDVYNGIMQVYKTYENFKKVLNSKGLKLVAKPKDTKWNWEEVIAVLSPIVDKLGSLPTSNEMDKQNLSGLRGYIDKNKLRSKLKFHFGVESKVRKFTASRKSGYWNKTENIINELQAVYNQFGRIPTNKILREQGYGALSNHIKKIPQKILEKFDYYSHSGLLKTKDDHYVRSNYELLFDNYLSYNNIPHKVEGLISEKIKRNFMYDFKLILKNDRIVYVEIWGYTRNRNKVEKSYHKKRLEKEAMYKKMNLSLISIESNLFEKSFSTIYKEISNKIKIYYPVFKPKKLNMNYFLWGSNFNENDIVEQLKDAIILNDGFFPSTSQLRKRLNGEGLISQIQKYGGVDYFKKKLGVISKKKIGKWTLDMLKQELKGINNLKYIPSSSDLQKLNRLDILGGIRKNGGFENVALKLNIFTKAQFLKLNPRPRKTKWTRSFLLQELKPIIKTLKIIPSESQLIKMGRSDLVVGIKKNGGFVKLKESLGLDSSCKKWSEQKVLLELNAIIEKSGTFPTSLQLKKMNRGDLLSGVNSSGGLNYFREKLGFPKGKIGGKSKVFQIDDVIKDVELVIEEIGYFPSISDLKKVDKFYLASRIQTVGGFYKLRRIMGYDSRKK